MASRSRSAAGASRYSAMLGQHPLFERIGIEGTRFTAGLTFNERGADRLHFGAAFLLAPDQVADVFTVVGIVPCFDLRLDPTILLVGQRDGLAHGSHNVVSK